MGQFELTVAPLLLTMDLFTPPANAPDFSAIYPNAIEEIDSCLLIPKGHELKITAIVDADHAHNQKSCRSTSRESFYLSDIPLLYGSASDKDQFKLQPMVQNSMLCIRRWKKFCRFAIPYIPLEYQSTEHLVSLATI
jgi:hypothetical protein